jgi:hypothetical protein
MTTERSIIVGRSVKKWRKRMRAEGRCINCGRKARGRTRCRACADRDNERARARRKLLVQAPRRKRRRT